MHSPICAGCDGYLEHGCEHCPFHRGPQDDDEQLWQELTHLTHLMRAARAIPASDATEGYCHA